MGQDDEYNFVYEFQQFAESLHTPLRSYDKIHNIKEDTNVNRSNSFYTTEYESKKYVVVEKSTKNITATDVVVREKYRNESDSLKRHVQEISTKIQPKSKKVTKITIIQDPQASQVIDDHGTKRLYSEKNLQGTIDSTVHENIYVNSNQVKNEIKLPSLNNITETAFKSTTLSTNNEVPKDEDDVNFIDDIDKSQLNLTISEAYEKGLFTRHESILIKSNPICLSDAITHGLVDTFGYIIDRNSGDKLLLDAAIANQLINPDIREIVDAKNDTKVTLNEALKLGILNSKTGRYFNEFTKEKLTYIEAKNRQLIVKPYTLKDICDLNLLDKHSKITSPMRRRRLTILKAIEVGILDNDRLKCVTKQKGELLTLKEALDDGIILPNEAKYKDHVTGETFSIPEAVERGLISSVSQKLIFNIDGFKDKNSNDFVSFNVALSRGILRKKKSEYMLEISRDKWVPLNIATTGEYIRPEVYEMFTRDIGVRNADGKQFNLFDLCFHDMIDTKSGYLLDPSTGKNMPLNLAIENKFITPQGALLLSSLLNITLTIETVTRTINRYVAIDVASYNSEKCKESLSFSEAIQKGLIDEEKKIFREPQSGKIYSIQQALSYGFLKSDPIDENLPESAEPKTNNNVVFSNTKEFTEHILNKKEENEQSFKIEIPKQGWSLKDAIEKKLFNPDCGKFTISETGQGLNLQQCIEKGIINDKSFSVIDPQSKDKLPVISSMENKILDGFGNYTNNNQEKYNMRTAINKGEIILESVNTELSAASQILDTLQTNTVPQSNVYSLQRKKISSPEPIQIEPGAIFDPSTALVICTESGQTVDILEATSQGLIHDTTVKIIDPQTNQSISISEAIKRKIYNPKQGTIKTANGETINSIDAIEKGILIVLGGPLVALEGALQEMRFVLDPSTGTQIPIEVAFERGIVSKAELSESKNVLQKMRKIILKPEDALKKGIIDKEAYEVLVSKQNFIHNGKTVASISEALTLGLFDGSKGKIFDPLSNRTFNMREAVEQHIIDPSELNHILIPIAKKLSIPKLMEQGLIDVKMNRFIHPESGRFLNIFEAIVCEILDPFSTIKQPVRCSIESAIKKKIIDGRDCTFTIDAKVYNLSEAIDLNIFDRSYDEMVSKIRLPPVGMTLPVIIERNLLNTLDRIVVHPVTNSAMPLAESLKKGFILPIPYTPKPNSVELYQAVDQNLIDVKHKTFVPSKGSVPIPIKQALETGALVINPLSEFVHSQQPVAHKTHMNTDNVTHTITTKTIELSQDYVLTPNYQVQNIYTGDLYSVKEAKSRGILSEKNVISEAERNVTYSDNKQLMEKESTIKNTNADDSKYSSITVLETESTFTETSENIVNTKIPPEKLNEANITLTNIETINSTERELKNKIKSEVTSEITDSIIDTRAPLSTTLEEGNITPESSKTDDNTDKILNKDVEAPSTNLAPYLTSRNIEMSDSTEKVSTDIIKSEITENIFDSNTLSAEYKTSENIGFVDTTVKVLTEATKTGITETVVDKGAPSTNVTTYITSKSIKSIESTDKVPVEDGENKATETILNTEAPTSKRIVTNDTTEKLSAKITENIVDTKEPTANLEGDMTSNSTKTPQSTGKTLNESQKSEQTESLNDIKISSSNVTADVIPNSAGTNSRSDQAPNENYKLEITEKLINNVSQSSKTVDNTIKMSTSEFTTNTNNIISMKQTTPVNETNKVKKQDSSHDMNNKLQTIKETAKLGALGIIGGPILAGKAIVDSLKETQRRGTIDSNIKSEEPLIIEKQSVNKSFTNNEISDTNKYELSKSLSQTPVDSKESSPCNDLTIEKFCRLKLYDESNQYFTNPDNGHKISFQTLVYDIKSINWDTIFVKNLSNGKFEDLMSALERPLLDRHNGHMVDPKSGKKVPFFECVNREWIIRREPEKKKMLAPFENVIDIKTGKVLLEDGQLCSIVDAINSGILDMQSISVRDPVTGEVIPLRMAIELGVVDMKAGTIIDIQTLREIPLEDAYKLGFLVSGNRKPISLEAALRKGLYDPQSGTLYDVESDNRVDIQESIEIGLVDPKISLILDTMNQKEVKLDCAIEDELVIPETGELRDTKTNILMPLNVGLEKSLLKTDNVTWSLPEVLQREYYIPNIGKVLNPTTGEIIPLQEAIDLGFIELDTCLIKDEGSNVIVSGKQAADTGILDIIRGSLSCPNLRLDEAFVKGYIISTKKPLSFVDCLLRGLYDSKTSKILIDEQYFDLTTAINLKFINGEELILLDPKTNSIISLAEAINKGYIDPVNGLVVNPFTETEMTFEEALENRILIPPKRKRSLPDAVHLGLYNSKTGEFSSTVSQEKLSTGSAIHRGILDPNSTIVCQAGQVIPFEQAQKSGIIDSCRGTVKGINQKPIDFKEAFENGVLIEARKPLRLSAALMKNLYNEVDDKFMDPKTGEKVSFVEAVLNNIISIDSIQIKNLTTGQYDQLKLSDIKGGKLINNNGKLVYNNKTYHIKEALDSEILIDTQQPISLQKALHKGLFDENSGKIIDPCNGRKISLFEALRNAVINSQLPCYFNEMGEEMYNLEEACRAGIINREEGVFREPRTNNFLSLPKALNSGLVIDIENGNFGLYELLAMKLYDISSRKVINPASLKRISLREACTQNVINLNASLIKNEKNLKYVPLADAIKDNIIEDINSIYNTIDSGPIDLQDARIRGLIISSQRPISLQAAIKMKLYQSNTNMFCDPISGEFFNLLHAIQYKLIDPSTTLYKNYITNKEINLNEAIENGDIDYENGVVHDPETRKPYTYENALKQGILITITKSLAKDDVVIKLPSNQKLVDAKHIKSIGSQAGVQTDKPLQMSLDEAIKCKIINPKIAVVRDYDSFNFIPLENALKKGIIDSHKRTLVDPKVLFFAFDNEFTVFVRQPITLDYAVDKKILDLESGILNYTPEEHNEEFTHQMVNSLEKPENIYTLKDAITIGIIDPDSGLIKDFAKSNLVHLPEAYRKGLISASPANVLNTETSKLCPLKEAYSNGLLITPKQSFNLLEAIQFNLYNPVDGSFIDPFQMNPDSTKIKKFTLTETIAKRLIDPSTTVVRNTSTGDIVPLINAINSGLIDAVQGFVIDPLDTKNNKIDFKRAVKNGILLPAEQRQAVFEKFNSSEENVNELLKWISGIEHKISTIGGPQQNIDELRNQINAVKQIKDEIENHQRPVATCLEHIRQIVLTGGDVLSAPEVKTLEKSGSELRLRFDNANDRTLRLLRRLDAGRDELNKVRSELDAFSNWLQMARRTLEDKEQAISDLDQLNIHIETVREFFNDVIRHQADLRFITMAAQKFVDESKEFLKILNEFRTSLPQRLPHIEPTPLSESPIRQEVTFISAQYKDLMNRVNALQERFSELGSRHREYQEAIDKALIWVRGIQPRVYRILEEPIGADPKSVQMQLDETKILHNEVNSNGRLMDTAQQALNNLTSVLNNQLSPVGMSNLEKPVAELVGVHQKMLDSLIEHCKMLDKTLMQTQDVQDALDNLNQWINQIDEKYKLQFRPASLIKERLEDQIREHKALTIDMQSHQASIGSIRSSTQNLKNNTSNVRITKKVETNLQDVTSKFNKLYDKITKRGEFFGNVYTQLCTSLNEISNMEREINILQDDLDSREMSSLPLNEFGDRMKGICRRIENLEPSYNNCIRNAKDLLNQRDITDSNILRDRIKVMESQWRNINVSFEEKVALSKQKAEHQTSYEALKDQVLSWLASMEAQVSSLSPVAIDLEKIRQQNEELKPICKNYRDFAHVIDKINDVGTHYDALIRPESPMRKRSTLSPNKRTSPLSRISGEARSPSPNKGGILSPLSTGSSGFGSRRSSQDGFQLSELSLVQQQLNEINNRYGLIGVRLNDRQNELDNMIEEVRKHYDNLKSLLTFLDRIQRQLQNETISSKEEVDRYNKQVRKILEDMYEKQTLLDTTKTQIKDILRRKPDVPGAEQLRMENENVLEKWRQLSDICKTRIEFSEKLRDFLDTYNNLKSWLDSKERMLTVLGTISSEPRMVQSQVQQVQVLREEFRAQHPQLKHFQEIGQYILGHSDAKDNIGIDKKLKEVKTKWEELIKWLDDRAKKLGGAADSSKEFDAALNRLKEALQQISDQLDGLPSNNDLQENLRKIENIERQLEGQRPLLADVEHSATALCHIISDAPSRADINARVAALEKQYQALQKKLDMKKAETEANLRDGRNFAESCSKTLGWLSTELANLNESFLVSANKPTLQHQMDTHEPIYRDVIAREHEIVMLLNKGKNVSDRQYDRTIKRDLDRIQQQWEKLRREVVERHTRLQTSIEHCKKYNKVSEAFSSWLRSAEDRLTDLTTGTLSKPKLDNRMKDLQTFRNDVWKHSGEYENTKGSCETFLNSCDIDKEAVTDELQNIHERWEHLNNELIARTHEIENYSRSLTEFNEDLRNLDHAVGRCEDRLSTHDALGGAAKDPKLLDRIKSLRDELTSLEKPLQSLKYKATDISAEARSFGGDAEYLIVEVNCISDRMKNLQSRLDDRLNELKSAATAVSQYNEQVKMLLSNLNALEEQVEKLLPPAREIKLVQTQIDEASNLQSKLEEMSSNIHECEYNAEILVDAGYSTDSIQTREQISILRKTLTRLEDRTRDHIRNLEDTLNTLNSFYDIHSNAIHKINYINNEYRHLKPVGSELDQIRRQKDDFLKFQSKEVDPLSEKIQKVNSVGQDLVRSAATGVSTNQIEKDLEKLNDRWNSLKECMNERSRRLDAALLQSGKFQEALAGLSKWLMDTEDMVRNQKPPSSDYKVVKAQLQEQKFLKKMLSDRQHSMTSLCNLSKEVVNHCDTSERITIEKQLQDLITHFDALTNSAEQRHHDLEEAMKVARHFHDKIIPLETWLENTERAVKSMELVPTDEEKIQGRIHEHENLHDEIIGKKPDFSDLADIGGQLMHLIGDDEAVALGEKIHKITDRYTSLVEASENIGLLLGESRKGLRHLVLTYQELVIWMEYMENELKRFHSIPIYIEKLMGQMDNLLEVNENIANHASNVESTVESGAELMKHISNDEALQLKDKLDSLQRRYGELATRGGDLLKASQNALPLVQQFHDAHNRLVEWIQIAEGALSISEPRQFDILRLEGEITEMRTVLDTINLVGPQLCQLSPGEGASVVENIIARVNRRFDAIVEQIQRKAERLNLTNQRAKEVTDDVDELLEWFREMDATLREADLPAIEPKIVRGQLQEHRSVNDDISSQKGRVRDVTTSAKKVLRESAQNENVATLREKLDDLKDVVDTVVQLCSERLGVLEQALALSEHFADSHSGLSTWFDDMEQQIARLSMPALRPDLISQQQDKNERLLQSINEHKPLLDKLNKTGETLAPLVAEEDNVKINEILDTDNSRFGALRQELRERQQTLEHALQESSQFADKIDGMLRALGNTVDQINQLDPLSALPQKIREQMDDNAAIIQDLDKRTDAYITVQRAANDVIAKASNKSDPAVRDIKVKLEKLNTLWNNVQKATKKRGSSLDDILSVAEPFWNQLHNVMKTLKDLEETLSSQEPPATQPKEIQKQQVALQEIRHEIDQTKPEVEQVRHHGNSLINLCGESDKPEVKKHIEDLDNAWDNITVLYAKREENLIDAMEKAMEFHEVLQNLLQFLTYAEEKLSHLESIGTDIEEVKKQIEQLKSFKEEVDPHMVEIEALNRQAIELTERTSTEQAASIREPLSTVNRRWENLLRGMVERQKQLEHALLHLGQFQHALNELLVWISKTDSTLDQLRAIPGDPQLLEVELAKLKVLANDIQAHQNSVDTLNDAGRQLIESEKGSPEASTTQEKLRKLNQEWKTLLQKASDRQHELEESLREAHEYIAEVQDILGWLGDVDAVIGASKPVGGLPETATEQLERFMEVYNELEENRPKVETIQAQGHEYIKRQNQIKVSSTNLQHTMRTLKQRWDAVVSRASDKKIKLEIALKEATEFHETLQSFVEWLTQTEKQLANSQPVSRVLATIQNQMEEHKVLQKDVSTHREAMLLLDKKGTHLKYFSQKQDVILIKNVLVSVQHRWERIVSKAAERTRALDHGYKEAREFNDTWSSLMQYLQETESVLDQIIEEATTSKEPQKLKKCIVKLKDTHRQLLGKQTLYDTTMRNGKNLIERAPKNDELVLGKMLRDLKDTWSRVLSKSIEHQRKLEEALLLSGQFSDALGELLDWLKKAKGRLNENGLVHGDLETVQGLCEHHKHIEQDLYKRSAQMQGVLKTGRGLELSGNNPDVGRQLDELQSIWDDVKSASVKRGERLQLALKDAEKLNGNIQSLFDWLDHAEHKLRYVKNAPDDEKVSREMKDAHAEFLNDLRNRERQKIDTFKFAEEIIAKAYPDAIPIIRNWLTIIDERWEEVKQWAINRESKLEQHLQSLKDLDKIIEELLAWLNGLETTLLNLEREPLPEEIPVLEQLIADHKEFMENTARRQNEVDRACKPKQMPSSTRRISRSGKTPIRSSSQDVREQSPDGTLRRQSFKGSREHGLNARKSSRMTPNRETPDRDRLPHYGPRFSPSSVGPEIEFRSARAKLLWDKWRQVWMLSWERQRRLNDHLLYLKDLERVRHFSWDDWRKRFLKYMNHKKSRLTDLFRKMDKDNNGLIPRGEFIDGIINTKFDTSRMEMGAVADLFDRNGEGLIDWQEFIAALRPDWQERKPMTDSDKIHDEVKRLVMLCTCRQKFRVFQVGEGKYRFGDSQKLRLVRILRSTVMVRVGGGWVALDEFLQKNDPCRAKGRTNVELREQFILADGVSQSMAAFTPRRSVPNATQNANANANAKANANTSTNNNLPSYMSGQGPIIKVRERSVRSVPMSKPPRSSLSASTPDSLSDNEAAQASGRYTPRKVTYTSTRNSLAPSANSRPTSKPNSRPLSRQGSKPSSRQGSTLSLDSTDEATPSRIPQRKLSNNSNSTPRPSRLSIPSTAAQRLNGASTSASRKTTSGSASPAPTRKTISGTSTPSGSQTPRKSLADPTFSSTMRRSSRGTTPVEKREPFRL